MAGLPDYARPKKPKAPKPPLRRRANAQQGRALEVLGHAVEYLVDSRMFEDHHFSENTAAVRLLMSCSRDVFADCEVVTPWHERVQKALLRKLHLPIEEARHTR